MSACLFMISREALSSYSLPEIETLAADIEEFLLKHYANPPKDNKFLWDKAVGFEHSLPNVYRELYKRYKAMWETK